MISKVTELRPLQPHEISQFAALLDQSFPVPEGAHFFEDFPVWELGSGIKRFGYFENSKLVASTGLRVCSLRVGLVELPVGLMGAVATAPNYREKGLASQCVEYALQEAKKLKLSAVFLWGSEHALYQRLGFELSGFQKFMPIGEFLDKWKSSHSTLKNHSSTGGSLFDGWETTIFKLMRKRESGVVLGTVDNVWMEKHKNVHWFTWRESGVVKAYAAYGRGIDMPGILHDWGGEPDAVFELFQALQKRIPQAQVLAGPAVLTPSEKVNPAHYPDALALVRILDPQSIFEKLGLHQNLTVSGDHPYYKVTLKGTVGTEWEVSSREFAQLVFGPMPSRLESFQVFGLPKSIWIWGLDAV